MNKLLIVLLFMFIGGCSKESEILTEERDEVMVFTVKHEHNSSLEDSYERFNEHIKEYLVDYSGDKPVIATYVENHNSELRHTMTIYFDTDTIDRIDFNNVNEPVSFSDYRNMVNDYSEDDRFPGNVSAVYDEEIPEDYFYISTGYYEE